MVRISRIRAKMPGFVWGFAHTQSGEGKRREGGREQGQPATTTKGETRGKTTNANQQAKQRKEKRGWGEEKAHRSPTLAPRRANSAKQNRQLKQDSKGNGQTHSCGCGNRGGRKKNGKEKGGGAMQSVSMSPPGQKSNGAASYTQVS